MNISVSDFDFEAERLADLSRGQAHSLDSQLHAQFYKHAELNAFKSREQGRKIFEEKVYIRILIPANRLNIIEREASDMDKQRFRRQWEAFLKGAEQLVSGTPLSEIPGITKSQELELRSLKVETAEQLAGIADSTVQLLGTGGPELKRRAQVYLATRSGNEKLVEELNEVKRQLAELVAAKAAVPVEAAKVTVTSDTPAKPMK
jgi:nucleotidyltransferase/DNA polymerase involved in DNA repair